MARLVNQAPSGQQSCIIITGQPGIGKTCDLYYILVLRIINKQPTLFQDRDCQVFLIKDEVYEVPPRGVLSLDQVYAKRLPKQDIFALVDGDGPNSVPQHVLLNKSIKIVLVSSPKTRDAWGWHIQNVMQDIEQTVTMEGWTWKDLAIAALFMAGYDISLYRLQLSVAVCGLVPRTCVAGAISAQALQHQMDSLTSSLKAISHNIPRLALAIQIGIHAPEQTFPHHVLHLHADDARPQLTSAIVRPVSQWALNAIDAELATSREGAALELYEQVQGASSWCGNMWKRRVHAFFRSLPSERTFEIQSLDDRSHTLKITFPPAGFSLAFGPTQSFTGHLATCMQDPKHSAYLTPISPVFATFDSFLYQRDFKVPGFRPLVRLQMTDAETHPVGITGLQEVQALLKPDTALEDLCPLVPHKWIFVFVVPEHMAASFPKQTYKEPSKKQKDPVGTWDKKVSQYVLGLGSEVWRCRAVAYHQETAL
ncbi:hypothetical protein BDN72DRAFT_905390 [Pluteus cervinus]|uniref:Uncharacterized protein n=1 Tax=Pluteus cervinus TaxID=181527 RepID=A0ACD3A3J9_9AGAR|nr:hypothetical protein BDN72DRAFT_905390 [Pluteus cervinus]